MRRRASMALGLAAAVLLVLLGLFHLERKNHNGCRLSCPNAGCRSGRDKCRCPKLANNRGAQGAQPRGSNR